MNNVVWDSECSSGNCESGWTLYLDHDSYNIPAKAAKHVHNTKSSSRTSDLYNKANVAYEHEIHEYEEQEEDLSMVSDASSGPPHFDDHEVNQAFNNNKNRVKRQKVKSNHKHKEYASFLDDTASSPAFNASKNNQQASKEDVFDYSQAFSATHFQGRFAYQEQFGFMQPSFSENPRPNNQWF